MCLYINMLAQMMAPVLDTLEKKIIEIGKRHIIYSPEQIFLFTDRDVYSAGDTLWFNAWLLKDQTLTPESNSRLLYVDLIDAENKILQGLLIKIENGTGSGTFYLPENLSKEGIFRIRGYTQWNLNFGNEYIFRKNIIVWQKDLTGNNPQANNRKYDILTSGNKTIFKRIKETGKKDIPGESLSDEKTQSLLPDLQFLPEGGKWYAGIPSRMAFKAISQDGYGVDIEGEIVDENDSIITTFRTKYMGMGSITMVPQKGKNYKARIITGQTFPLPEVHNSGVGIQINPFKNNRISGTIYFTEDLISNTNNAEYYLVTNTAGYIYTNVFIANKQMIDFEIPIKELPGGITELTLIDPDVNPIVGRICFVPAATRQINMEWTSEIVPAPVPEDGSGSVLNLTLKTTSAYDNKPVSSSVAVALTDEQVSPIDETQLTLRSQMLLSGMLKGKVENPDYYFANPYDSIYKNLDLVMLTHGWRKYTEFPDTSSFNLNTYNSFNVSGRVSNALNSGIKQLIVLLAQGDHTFVTETTSDSVGRFIFKNLPFKGMTYINLIAPNKRGKIKKFNVDIEVDSIPTAQKPDIGEPDISWSVNETTSLFNEFREREKIEKSLFDSLTRMPGITYIEPVTITANRIIKGSYNRNKSGNADIVLDNKDLDKYDSFTDIIDVLYNELPGLSIGWFGDPIFDSNIGGTLFTGGEKIVGYNFFSKVRRSGYAPLFAYYNRPVFFLVDGFNLLLYMRQIINTQNYDYGNIQSFDLSNNALSSISVCDIEGIEVMIDYKYTWIYNNGVSNSPNIKKPIFVEITTKSGYGPTQFFPEAGFKDFRIKGAHTPKEFYTPKYMPEDYADRFDYHQQPTLYWNPSLTTDSLGIAKISIPIGSNYPRTLQIISEGHNLKGKVGSGFQTIKVGTGKGAW